MKVLQVLPELGAGGVERTARDIARALTAAGHSAFAASAGGPLAAEIEEMGGVHYALPLASKNPLVWRQSAAQLSRIIRAENIDIVHARSRAPARPALWAARKTGAKFITTYHGIYNARGPAKRRYNSIMARGQHVIANSEYTKAHIIKEHGTAADKITAIARGVDLAAFPLTLAAPRIAALRAHWGVSPDERVLLLPGRLTRWKGQAEAIKAMDGTNDLTLVIQGDAQGRSAYTAELKALIHTVNARIIIAPPHSDMAAAYAASFGVMSASTDPEAFGRVTAEGCAMGKPVIATAHGGTLEILDVDPATGESALGLLAAPRDIASLSAQIRRLAAMSAQDAESFALPAQRRARRLFTNSAMCAATLEVYRRVIDA